MIRRIALTVLAFVVLAGLTVGVSLIAPERRPASAAVELPRTSSVTCGVAGEVFAVADSAFAARDLSGTKVEFTGRAVAWASKGDRTSINHEGSLITNQCRSDYVIEATAVRVLR